jgi:hypothetical protein
VRRSRCPRVAGFGRPPPRLQVSSALHHHDLRLRSANDASSIQDSRLSECRLEARPARDSVRCRSGAASARGPEGEVGVWVPAKSASSEGDREAEPRRQRLKPHDGVRSVSVRPLPRAAHTSKAIASSPVSGSSPTQMSGGPAVMPKLMRSVPLPRLEDFDPAPLNLPGRHPPRRGRAARRQRVGELEGLVGQLKRRLWPTA